jgi:hypothetical protein
MTRRNMSTATLALLVAALGSGCHSADPMPNIYVLGNAVPARATEVSQLGQPVIEIKQAQLPDYLDTSDIIENGPDGRMLVSNHGRWAERLSVGVTRAVALSLAAQLPGFAVTTSPPSTAPWRQVRIDIDAFAAGPDGNCVATVDWRVGARDNGELVAKQRTTLAVPVTGTGDAAVVAAMSGEVDTIADRIALALRVPSPGRLVGQQERVSSVHRPAASRVSAIAGATAP